jgi:hypothetical protein
MRGLSSFVSWRTFLTGFILGYVIAWKMHWAAQQWSWDRGWVDQKIPILSPDFGHRE